MQELTVTKQVYLYSTDGLATNMTLERRQNPHISSNAQASVRQIMTMSNAHFTLLGYLLVINTQCFVNGQ